MSSQYGLTRENLLRTLPDILRNDSKMLAIASSIADVLSQRPDEIKRLMIYTQIDSLPESLLDIIAHDFKVDWWDADYTIDVKRKTLKDSWRVHRTLGTKAAVETAMSAIYNGTKVSEWFEYNGNPFCFKLLLDATYENVDPVKHRRVLERVSFYKNLRSHLDGIEYVAVPQGYCRSYGAAAAVGRQIEITVEVAIYGLE